MNQTLNALFQRNKGTVVDNTDDFAGNAFPDRILVRDHNPRIFKPLFVTKGNSFLFTIESEYDNFDLVTDLEVLVRMAHSAPRNVGDVKEAVQPAQINKDPVVGDVLDGTTDQHALFEPGHRFILDLRDLNFKQGLPGKNDICPATIEGNDARFDFLVDVIFKPSIGPNVDQRPRKESSDTDING